MVFVLDAEQGTSSTLSARSSRVRRSLPNQFTCVLWDGRRHSNASLGDSCRGFSWMIRCQAPLCGLSATCIAGVRVLSALSTVSQTHLR